MYNFGGTKLSGKVSLGVRGEKRLNTTALEEMGVYWDNKSVT
jgi:hypothetical protein